MWGLLLRLSERQSSRHKRRRVEILETSKASCAQTTSRRHFLSYLTHTVPEPHRDCVEFEVCLTSLTVPVTQLTHLQS